MTRPKEWQSIMLDDESEIAKNKLEYPQHLGSEQVLELLGGRTESQAERLRKTTAHVRMPRVKENLT